MACSSFLECIGDPLAGLPASATFSDLSTTARFSINLAMYLFYALLVIWIGWSLFKTIYALYGGSADESETFEKFRGALLNAVFAAVGLVILVSAPFILRTILSLLGVPNADNIFLNLF